MNAQILSRLVRPSALFPAVVAVGLGAGLFAGCARLRSLPPPADAGPVLGPRPDSRPVVLGDLAEEAEADARGSRAPAVPGAGSALSGAIPPSYRDLRYAPLQYQLPLISDFADTLPSGAVVYWVPDSQLPIASLQFIWNEGTVGVGDSALVPAQMLGGMLRQGGTARLTPRQVDDTLEFLAASVSVSVGDAQTEGAVGSLSRDLPAVLDLFGEMLLAPRYDSARLAVVRDEVLQNLAHRYDAPAHVGSIAWEQVSAGPSPWTRVATPAEVRAVTRRSLENARRGRFQPARCRIGVAGKFDRDDLRRRLDALMRRLGSQGGGEAAVAAVSQALPALPPPGVYLVDAPEATQAFLTFGTRFVRRDHPDYYPMLLASYVLGQGGFGSRLVDRVRSDEGLAYSVQSFAGSSYEHEAMLGVSLQTKLATASRAIELSLREIRELREKGFRPGELERARQSLAQGIPSLFDTPEGTASLLVQSAAWNRRDDHFRLYRRALDSIPDSVVLATFRRWFDPDSMRVIIAGPVRELLAQPAEGNPPLRSFGPVHLLERSDLELRRGTLPLRPATTESP